MRPESIARQVHEQHVLDQLNQQIAVAGTGEQQPDNQPDQPWYSLIWFIRKKVSGQSPKTPIARDIRELERLPMRGPPHKETSAYGCCG